jgi:hypothetical protein
MQEKEKKQNLLSEHVTAFFLIDPPQQAARATTRNKE